jgi:hypothetical protein
VRTRPFRRRNPKAGQPFQTGPEIATDQNSVAMSRRVVTVDDARAEHVLGDLDVHA